MSKKKLGTKLLYEYLKLQIIMVAPDTELAGYPAIFLPDIRYPAE